MVSKRLKVKVQSGGTLFLDAQGLSLHVDGDEGMRARFEVAEHNGRRVALSAVTPLEVRRTGDAAKRLAFLLSRLDVKPVTDDVIRAAAKLLDASGLDRHECLSTPWWSPRQPCPHPRCGLSALMRRTFRSSARRPRLCRVPLW